MKRNRIRAGVTILFLGVLGPAFLGIPGHAGEDVQELSRKVAELERRLERLETGKALDAPSVTPDSFSWDYEPDRDPFSEIRRMQEEMDRLFRNFHRRYPDRQPGLPGPGLHLDNNFEMRETDNGYAIHLDLRGLDQDKVDVEINQHSVTVTGEYSAREKQAGPGSYAYSQSTGSFLRTIPLPVDADTAKVKTEKKGDTLVITVPKTGKRS